ncbi:MAG: ABC transporter ATP-binding protein [Egibacteraceae bacterium]
MSPAIAVTELVKRYGEHRAVDGLSLSVEPGEILALLGPNGAGKTSTAECIAGLRRPDGGHVEVLGVDPATARGQVDGQLGVMLQEGGVHRSASPAELVRTFAAYYDDPLDPDGLITELGLAAVAKRRVRTLSGGETQRVSLALALVGRPRVALLDEPTVGMDPATRRATWQRLAGLREDGVAVLLTTHLMEEAERLADRVAVIDRGKLVALDAPEALTAPDRGLHVETSGPFEPSRLAAALSCEVTHLEGTRWHVDLPADRLSDVAAWFASHGIALSGVAVARQRLEDVYLRLTEVREVGDPQGGDPHR